MLARYDCSLMFEGPVTPELLFAALAEKRSIPLNEISGDLALISRPNTPVAVLNGRADLDQGLLCVYERNGSITRSEIAEMNGTEDRSVDFVGSIRLADGGRFIDGKGVEDVMKGEIILVRQAAAEEPPASAYIVQSLDSSPGPRIIRCPQVVEVDSRLFNRGEGTTRIPVDLVTGEPVDAIMPDGSFGFKVGCNDHVVLLLLADRQIVKGTKADMLAAEDGILATLRRRLPDKSEGWDIVESAVRNHDPNLGILVATIPAEKAVPKITITERPDCDRTNKARNTSRQEHQS